MITLILDATWLARMNYHAIPKLTNSVGEPTGASYGYVGSLIKVLRAIKPDYCMACFDRGEELVRKTLYPGYKIDHKAQDQDLWVQWPTIYEATQVFGIERYETPGYEADDLIGTLSKMAEEKGHDDEVIIYAYDADLFQLVSPQTTVLTPKQKVNESIVKSRYGLTPRQIPDYKALVGDPSDCIPRFLGEKTAESLLRVYFTIDGIYRHIYDIERVDTTRKLIDNEQQIRLNLRLTTIERNLPILFPTKLYSFNDEEVIHFLKRMEFRTLLGRFEHWRLREAMN